MKLNAAIYEAIKQGYRTVDASTYTRTHAHRRDRLALQGAIYLDQLVNHGRKETRNVRKDQ